MQAEAMQAVAARLHQLHAPGPENSGAAAALELLNLVNEKGRELAHQASCGYQVDAAEVERLHLALREAHSSLESLNGTTSAEWSLANQEVARQRLQAEVQAKQTDPEHRQLAQAHRLVEFERDARVLLPRAASLPNCGRQSQEAGECWCAIEFGCLDSCASSLAACWTLGSTCLDTAHPVSGHG
jgi:hypothetical protein